MVVKAVAILFLIADICNGVIYRLNESEYERMPPLFGMDSNYHSCLMQPGGVYCVAKFELQGDPYNELIHTINEYSQHEIKHYNHSVIDRAICITQSCKKFTQNKTLTETADLNMTLERCINETISTEYGLEAKLTHVLSCDRHDDNVPVDLVDWTVAGILILLLASNLLGSLYDALYLRNQNQKNNTIGNPYLLSFSIFRSWEKLSNTNTDLIFERFKGIHGIKSITTFFVPLAHVMWIIGTGYTDNPRELETSHDYLHYQIILNGLVIVQIFFVISGCLLAFHLQMLSENGALTWKDIPKMFFIRLTRLTPANAIVVLFTATWLRHLGYGPLWKISVVDVAAGCRVHWWKHLLYFNNYVPQDKNCVIQTWHLATEVQLFTIGLIVYIATAFRGRFIPLTVLALVGMIAPALHVWLQDLDALVIIKPEFFRTFDNDTYRSLHVLGHNNLSSHAIGMVIGLFSYYCIKHNIEYPHNKLLKFLTWCVPLGIIGVLLSGNLFYVDGDRPHVILRMAYAAIQRPAIGFWTAILLLSLVLKSENAIRRTLEWRGWVITSRLCYGVFLLHVNLIHILLGLRRQLGHVSFLYVVINHFGVVSLTFAAAIPFYLMLEVPMTTITKLFLGQITDAQQKKLK